jgi:hypothetical protein
VFNGRVGARIRRIEHLGPLCRWRIDRRDLLAGGDERPIEAAVGLVKGEQERLDPAPHLDVGRAFAVEDGTAIGRGCLFEGRQEQGLDAARVERHGVVLASGSTSSCAFSSDACRNNPKMGRMRVAEPEGPRGDPLLASELGSR